MHGNLAYIRFDIKTGILWAGNNNGWESTANLEIKVRQTLIRIEGGEKWKARAQERE